MSFDLLPEEGAATMLRAARNPSLAPDPGIWGGFASGAASLTMRGLAATARSIDLLGAVGPIVEDRLSGGTQAQDAYFREHDETFNRAVDYWTPGPGEVGTAGRVVGGVLPMLAQAAVSPSLAVGSAELGTAEDLVRQGVDAHKAVGVGIAQGTGLGLGMYLPIFGNSLAVRALVAGAGANVAQGVITRAASRAILGDSPAAAQFDPWDSEALIVDSLMGIGFGTLAHLGAAPGEAAYREMAEGIRARLTETDRAAILAANQVRHLEDTTAPGRPLSDADRTAHALAMREAVDDLLNGRPAQVGQVLQEARFAADPARVAAAEEVRGALADEARAALVEGGGEAALQGDIRVPEGPEIARSAEGVDPVIAEARGRLAQGEVRLVGDDGQVRDLGAELDAATLETRTAQADAGVFRTAVACFLGEL